MTKDKIKKKIYLYTNFLNFNIMKKEERASEEQLKAKARDISIKEANAYSLMDGFGLRYITPFANAIGVSNKYIGLLTSVPSLLGNFSQLYAPRLMEKTSRKKIVFTGVLLQSIMWLALIALGIFYFFYGLNKETTSILLVAIYSILIIFGAFPASVWSSWMKDLVHPGVRGTYFGRRNKIAGTIALACMFSAGFILDYFKHTKIFIAFIILFSLAFLGRLISSFYFLKQYEPKIKLEKGYYFSFKQFIKRAPFNNFGKFSIMLALINFATAIASPFFAIYLLDSLQFNTITYGYIFFTLVTIAAPITSLLFMTPWGRLSDRYGTIKIMRICSHLIPIIPLFWILSSFLVGKISMSLLVLYLIFGESLSGIVWAGFNLAAGNFIYDAVTRERMALCTAYHSILNGIGVFIGATLGGIIASYDFRLLGLTSLLFVFLISAVLRFAVIRVMIPKIKEVREVDHFHSDEEAIEKIIKVSPLGVLADLGTKITKPRPG